MNDRYNDNYYVQHNNELIFSGFEMNYDRPWCSSFMNMLI